MTIKDISRIRLYNQQIAVTTFKAAKDIVGWMGAMQAQDYAMSKWAIGARMLHGRQQIIETAIDKGEIIRTHLLRPTWHFVTPNDIYWMLELTAPRLKASMKLRNKELQLTESILKKSRTILTKELKNGNHLTREEIAELFTKSKIATNEYRLAHIMFDAELDGIICSGKTKNKKQTYALLSERALRTKAITRKEALAKLAKKYFTSHGPATLRDFAWWSGLSANDAKNAIEMVKSDFIAETIGVETYWLASTQFGLNTTPSLYLLPAYDEFTISYKNRTASLLLENHKKVISTNGIFRPIIVMDGQVTGLWKRTIKKDKLIIETEFFKSNNKSAKVLVEKAAGKYGYFLDKKVEVIFNDD